MPQHESNASGSEPEAPSPEESGGFRSLLQSPFARWLYLAIFLALAVHFVLNWGGEEIPSVEYSTFLDSVESGSVERVEIVNDTRIEGRYTEQAVREGTVEARPPTEDGLLGSMTASDRRAFTTTKPADHELTAFLRRHNAEAAEADAPTVTFTARTEEEWVGTAILWLVPLLLLVGAWFLFMRRMNPGAQMLDIGNSTATLFEDAGADDVTFDDVAGLEEAKEEVAEVVEFLRSPGKFTRLGGTLPTGVLLVGPPGTGKTLMAKAVAGEAGVPFFSISGSDFMEMFVGVGASRVRDLFESAKKKAPCIVFIDEMDAIGRTRGNNMVSGNDERDNTLNQLLVEMDGFDSDEGVVIMAATNRPDILDSALLRPGRFDRQIVVDKPDRRERAEIFRVHVRTLVLDGDANLEVLARQTPGFAGAEIANVCNEAALLAARKDKDAIEMVDFEEAIDRVIAGLEKKNKLISPEERKVIAYHESGHALVGWFLEHTDPVVKVSIVPRGLSALGYAQRLPEERYLYSTEALLDRMTMALAGRVAEDLVFDRVTTGAQNDLERVTKMAYAMVVDYGMSDRIGALSYNLSQRDEDRPLFDKPYSDATAQAIDEEVQKLVETAQSRARELLQEKRSMLTELADALLESEVLDADALVDILGERPHGGYVATNGEAGPSGAAPVSGVDASTTEQKGSSSESGSDASSAETTQKGPT